MIGALLLSAVSVPQVPAVLDLPHALERSTVELGIQATETHFVARSYSEAPIVLFFGAPGSDARTRVNLPAQSEVHYTFCRGCLDDVYVEALTLHADGWSNTGSLSLADVAASAHGALWVQSFDGRSVGWLGEAGGVEHALPDETLLPDSLLILRRELDSFREPAAPMHVPVITPEPEKDDSKPPVIEPTPLPPV